VAINEELRLFNPLLAQKPQVVVLNKLDVPEVREAAPRLLAELREAAGHSRVMNVSAATGENCRELLRRTAKLADAQPPAPTFAESEPGVPRVALDVDGEEYDAQLGLVGGRGVRFDIETDPAFPGQFRVKSSRIEKMVQMTNWEYFEATARFERVLEATGIIAALEERGAVEGDLIMIADLDFDYSPKRNKYIPQDLLDRDERWAETTAEAGDYGMVAAAIELDGSMDDGADDDDDDDDDDYVFNPADFDLDFDEMDFQADNSDHHAAADHTAPSLESLFGTAEE
jgi:Obg family GTPase CgtA-like protein